MSTVTDSDLKELKALILSSQQQLETKLSLIQQEINDLRVTVVKIESDLQAQKPIVQKIPDLIEQGGKIESALELQQPLINKIPDMTEKIGELKNWKQVGLVIVTAGISSVFTGTIGGVIGWLIRGGNLKP